jgi:hypothetical protein
MAFGDADGAIHLMTAGSDDEPGMFRFLREIDLDN